MKRFQILVPLLVAALLLGLCLATRPFAVTVLGDSFSTRTLTRDQLTNLNAAAHRLDGTILQAGETFSFNRAVGPRTSARGYVAAPSYLGGESPATVGGGICLLSSALYKLALESGFDIQSRTPHLRTVRSVPPGLDATVWYGGADLRFVNTLPQPIRIRSQVESGALKLSWQGTRTIEPQPLQRHVSQTTGQDILVTVLRGGQPVSRDRYGLAP